MSVLLISALVAVGGAALVAVPALLALDYSSRNEWRGAIDKLSEAGHFSEDDPDADVEVPNRLLTLKEVHEKLGPPNETRIQGDYTIDVYRWPGLLYTYVLKVDYQGRGERATAVKIRPASVMRLAAREDDVLPDFVPARPQAAAPAADDGAPPMPPEGEGGPRAPAQVEPPQFEPGFRPGGFERGRGGRRGPRRDQGRNFI
jgi:hypothetical protein